MLGQPAAGVTLPRRNRRARHFPLSWPTLREPIGIGRWTAGTLRRTIRVATVRRSLRLMGSRWGGVALAFMLPLRKRKRHSCP